MHASSIARPVGSGAVITEQDLSEQHTTASQLWPNVQRLLWILGAASVVVYGNGHHDFFTVVLHHPAVWK